MDSKLKVDDILQRVENIEDDRADYVNAAEVWEKMWRLEYFSTTGREAVQKDGVERIVTPTPYNVVQLGLRLVASTPRIEVPSNSPELKDEEAATKKERFLSAFWERSNRQQRVDIINNAAWQSLVRGRHAFEVKWIKDELPKRLQEKRLPILVRTIDPLNVGSKQGPYYTEYAFHKWDTSRLIAKQWFPDLRWNTKGKRKRLSASEEDEEVCIIDFWWVDDYGDVWNSIVVEEEQFGKKPFKTDYPEVPIVEGYADSAPLDDELYKGVSILHPIKDMWPYENRLVSQMGTGMLYYFNPIITYKTDTPQNIELEPGSTMTIGENENIGFVQPSVNMQLAEAMFAKIDSHIQTSTFPNVMYGQQPGQVQAGYAINTLASQAKSRAGQIRINLESSIELVNQIVLGLIEHVGDEEVSVWGTDEGSGDIYHESLGPKDISGYYENTVTLVPDVSQDEAARLNLMMQMVDKKILSGRTGRDKYVRMALPADEEKRIAFETAAQGPLASKVQLRAIQDMFPDTYKELIRGTEFEAMDAAEEQPQGPPQGEQMPPDMMGGMPPNMPPGMPPMPQGPSPSAPPGMGGGPPPDMMGGGMPPGMPEGMGGIGAVPQMPSQMLPPQESGVMPPDLMAILEDPSLPPEIKAIIQQDPMTAMEQLRAMGVLPPEGMA